MEFHHADSAEPSTMEEAKLRNYYTYYIVPQEKRVPSLLESISNLQGETHKGNVGGLDRLCSADGMLLERVRQDSAAIDFVIRQIEERELLKERHLTQIDEGMSYAKEQIWHLDHWYMGRNRGIDQARNQFHRQLNSLEQERRTVEAAAWRDEAMLMKDFVEHWTAYRNDFFSYSVLNPRGGA